LIEREFGARGYRMAQTVGGIIGGRIYLASHALGLGATGLTFYDDAVVEFFWASLCRPGSGIRSAHRRSASGQPGPSVPVQVGGQPRFSRSRRGTSVIPRTPDNGATSSIPRHLLRPAL
jgi:hypothetical protein